jgi:tetrahydromethanopterin S-methyltransferase subunit D
MLANPSMFGSERPTPGLIAIIVLGFAGMIYTLYLYVYGVVVSPSEDKSAANIASEVTARKLAEPQG